MIGEWWFFKDITQAHLIARNDVRLITTRCGVVFDYRRAQHALYYPLAEARHCGRCAEG